MVATKTKRLVKAPVKKGVLTKTYIQQAINTIRAADKAQVEAQFEIANLLAAIKEHKLYENMQYSSFDSLVVSELDFAVNAAHGYVKLYCIFTSLQYSKEAYLKLMQQFGWRRLNKALQHSPRKLGYRAIKARLQEMDDAKPSQFNLLLTKESDVKRLENLLKEHGLRTSEGRRSGLTTSMIALIDDYEQLKSEQQVVSKKKTRPKKNSAHV